MMYDHEKSDPAIVAVKPTNKAGQPAAELAEPRAGAEGNAREPHAVRAQNRDIASPGLARLRAVAKDRKRKTCGAAGTGTSSNRAGGWEA